MTTRQKRRGMTALDPMMAGFAAGASAFIVYAMPGAQFEEAVALSGLPMVLPAAAAPLGMTARLLVMAAAGLASFVLVLLVLRALGKPAPQPKRRAGPVEIDLAPPKLRRADAHPDAPARRPILAGMDLGRPFDDLPAAETSADTSTSSTNDEEEQASFLTEPFAEADEQPAEVLEDSFEEIGFRHAADEEDPQDMEPFEGVAAALVEPEEEATDVAPIPLRQTEAEDEETPSRQLFDPSEPASETIPDLMARLEAGLRRRQPESLPAEISHQPAELRAPAPDQIDQRLRGAIEELQKLAARGN